MCCAWEVEKVILPSLLPSVVLVGRLGMNWSMNAGWGQRILNNTEGKAMCRLPWKVCNCLEYCEELLSTFECCRVLSWGWSSNCPVLETRMYGKSTSLIISVSMLSTNLGHAWAVKRRLGWTTLGIMAPTKPYRVATCSVTWLSRCETGAWRCQLEFVPVLASIAQADTHFFLTINVSHNK